MTNKKAKLLKTNIDDSNFINLLIKNKYSLYIINDIRQTLQQIQNNKKATTLITETKDFFKNNDFDITVKSICFEIK